MNERVSFLIRFDWEFIKELSDSDCGKFLKASYDYNLGKPVNIENLPKEMKYLFPIMISYWEKCFQTWQQECNRRYVSNCKRRGKEVDENLIMKYKTIRDYIVSSRDDVVTSRDDDGGSRGETDIDIDLDQDLDLDRIKNKTKIKNNNKNKIITYEQDFEDFWKEYPKKKGKQRAYEAWHKVLNNGYQPSMIIQKAKDYATECKLKHVEEKYIKRPQGRLNEGRYDDDFYTGVKAEDKEDKSYLDKLY